MDKTVIGLVSLSILALVTIVLFAGRDPASQPPLGEEITILPAEHIDINEPHPDYNSNPPTSGWHSANPAPWGVQTEPMADETAIHNLEHGGIWITYNPATTEPGVVDQLANLVRSYRSKVLLSPRAATDAPIALASWGRLLKLDNYNETQIKDFIERNKNRGPEQIPD